MSSPAGHLLPCRARLRVGTPAGRPSAPARCAAGSGGGAGPGCPRAMPGGAGIRGSVTRRTGTPFIRAEGSASRCATSATDARATGRRERAGRARAGTAGGRGPGGRSIHRRCRRFSPRRDWTAAATVLHTSRGVGGDDGLEPEQAAVLGPLGGAHLGAVERRWSARPPGRPQRSWRASLCSRRRYRRRASASKAAPGSGSAGSGRSAGAADRDLGPGDLLERRGCVRLLAVGDQRVHEAALLAEPHHVARLRAARPPAGAGRSPCTRPSRTSG